MCLINNLVRGKIHDVVVCCVGRSKGVSNLRSWSPIGYLFIRFLKCITVNSTTFLMFSLYYLFVIHPNPSTTRPVLPGRPKYPHIRNADVYRSTNLQRQTKSRDEHDRTLIISKNCSPGHKSKTYVQEYNTSDSKSLYTRLTVILRSAYTSTTFL